MGVPPSDPQQPQVPREPDDRIERLAGILEEAEHAHGAVSASRNFVDPEWPLFYAWWLLTWSDFAEVLGAAPTRSDLVHDLIDLDRAYRNTGREETWSAYYARHLAEGHPPAQV